MSLVGQAQSSKELANDMIPLEIQIKTSSPNTDHHLQHHRHSNHHHHMQEDLEKYLDMQSFNPDWQFAQQHGNSTKPGIANPYQKKQECICCLRQINKTPLPFCQNSKQLEFLGYGFPLYYIFMKYALIVLLLEIINYTGIELYWACDFNYDFCVNNSPIQIGQDNIYCTSWMIFVSRIDQTLLTDEHLLRVSSFLTLLVALIYIRDQFTKVWKYYDERETSYSDFAILIENLPTKQVIRDHSKTIGMRLRQFLNDTTLFPDSPSIARINLIGEITVFQQLEHERKTLIHSLQAFLQKNFQLKKKYHERQNSITDKEIKAIRDQKVKIRHRKHQIQSELKQVEQKLKAQKVRLKILIANQDLDCDKAIICFNTQSDMVGVLKGSQRITEAQMQKYFIKTTNLVVIRRAPEPHQINWEFMNEQQAVRVKRRIISFIIFFVILGSLTVGIYYLFNFKSHEVEEASDSDARAIVFCSLLGIIFFNKFVLSYIIHHLVQFEMHRTGQNSQFSFTLKYSLGLFFTTALMTVLVEGVTHHNIFNQNYGLIEEETIMFFLSAFLVPLIWLINPWHLLRLLERKLHENSHYLTQEEANKLMEEPQYLMGKRYGQVLEMLWFTFLYSCIIPLGSVLIFIGLTLYYWVDKFNLLRRSSILQGVSGNLCMKALFLLEFILLLKPAGELIFDGLIRNQWNVIPIVQICVGFVYLCLPMTAILQFFHPEKFKIAQSTYEQLKQRNFLSYELYNPLSKEEELKHHFQKIQQCTDDIHDHSIHKKQKQNSVGQPLVIKRISSKQKKHSISRPHNSRRKKRPDLHSLSFSLEDQNQFQQKLQHQKHHKHHGHGEHIEDREHHKHHEHNAPDILQ